MGMSRMSSLDVGVRKLLLVKCKQAFSNWIINPKYFALAKLDSFRPKNLVLSKKG